MRGTPAHFCLLPAHLTCVDGAGGPSGLSSLDLAVSAHCPQEAGGRCFACSVRRGSMRVLEISQIPALTSTAWPRSLLKCGICKKRFKKETHSLAVPFPPPPSQAFRCEPSVLRQAGQSLQSWAVLPDRRMAPCFHCCQHEGGLVHTVCPVLPFSLCTVTVLRVIWAMPRCFISSH